MMTHAKLVIIGAGPAGLAAAIQARELGVNTLVLDENASPGGQIYRQLPAEFEVREPKVLGPTFAPGAALLAAAERADVLVHCESVVWNLDESLNLEVTSPAGSETIQAKRVILAAGAYDRPVPVPGWTLPGVFTVGGAQNLLKSQSLVVGRRVLLAGTGPLLLVVASQLAEAGADIVVADPVPRRAVLGQLPRLVSGWKLLRDGARYHWNLIRHGSQWLSPYLISSIKGDGRVQRATVARVDASWRRIPGTERSFEVNAVGLGYGLLPSTELARLAGCKLDYNEKSAAWLPVLDDDCSTTVRGLAVAGDGAGIAGSVAAVEQGRIAAIAAARDLRYLDRQIARDIQQPIRKRLRALNRFRAAVDTLYTPRSGLHELATPETIVCRCEEVTASEIEEAVSSGIDEIELLKVWTRATMGPCQGRMCLPALLARTAEARQCHAGTVQLPRPRPPSKPLPLAWLNEMPPAGEV